MHRKSLQSCPTLCSLMDSSPPDSLSVGFSRQEHWSGLPCPSPEDLPDLGLELASVCVFCIVGRFFTHRATWEASLMCQVLN